MQNSKVNMLKHAQKTHVLQYNQSWCGLACMASAVKYYGGVAKQEQMVSNSGTTITGTTLLGLYHLAPTLGLEADGYEGDTKALKDVTDLAILHILNENSMQHYVVCYGWNGSHFIIGDPGKGVVEMTEEELNEAWKSKSLLLVKPASNFVKQKELRSQRWLLAKELTRNDWGILGVAVAMGVVLAALGLSLAIFSQKLVDKLLPGGDVKKLVASLVVIFLLLMAKNFIGYLRGILLTRQSKDFGNRTVSWFFGISMMLPKRFFDSLKTGDMVARLNDTRRLQQVLSAITSSMVIDLLGLIAALILLISYSTWLGVVSLSAVIVFPIITMHNSKRIKEYQQQVMASYATSESCFVNTIQGVEAIKSSQVEQVHTEKVAQAYGNYQEKSYDLGLFSNKLGLIFQTAATIILVAVVSFGAFGVLEKWLTVGELMAALSLASTVVGTAASLSLAIVQFQEANVAFTRLHDFIQGEKEETLDESNASSIRIETIALKEVSFRYPGRSLLLDKASLVLHRGEITCLMGEIGRGKSTILQLLQRFYIPGEGTIEINAKEWSGINTPLLRSCIGVAPQEVKLLNATLLENIAMRNDLESLQQAETLCQQLGFNRFFQQLPLGLLTPVGEDGVNLSGGQRQLLGLCRALVRKPSILLLDEPTASLDREAANFVRLLIQDLKVDKIILIVTHLPDMLPISDKLYLLHNKKLEQKDKVMFYRELCEDQMVDFV